MEKVNLFIYEQLANLIHFRKKLADEKSERFLDGYVNSLLGIHQGIGNVNDVIETLMWEEKMSPDIDFERFMKDRDKHKIIIFGAGKDGKKVKRLLEQLGMPAKYFCDNDESLWGENIDGIEVINPKKLNYMYRDYVVIIGSRKFGDVFFRQLLSYLFPQQNIYCSRYGILRVNLGWQYFGLPFFNREQHDFFLDCGCLDGGSTHDFIQWCDGNYKKIYAFEPDNHSFLRCQDNLKGLKNVDLLNAGLWDETGILHFRNDGNGASKIDDTGCAEVQVMSIDHLLKGEKATFIKMDIEGAELKALKGAENTIKTFYPKLAISVYHKWVDLIEISEYLMRIAPDYHYAIRTHTSSFSETVLYAWR